MLFWPPCHTAPRLPTFTTGTLLLCKPPARHHLPTKNLYGGSTPSHPLLMSSLYLLPVCLSLHFLMPGTQGSAFLPSTPPTGTPFTLALPAALDTLPLLLIVGAVGHLRDLRPYHNLPYGFWLVFHLVKERRAQSTAHSAGCCAHSIRQFQRARFRMRRVTHSSQVFARRKPAVDRRHAAGRVSKAWEARCRLRTRLLALPILLLTIDAQLTAQEEERKGGRRRRGPISPLPPSPTCPTSALCFGGTQCLPPAPGLDGTDRQASGRHTCRRKRRRAMPFLVSHSGRGGLLLPSFWDC